MFLSSEFLSVRLAIVCLASVLWCSAATAGDVLPPASERFTKADAAEEPSFQRHVLPLMGRLGCNGRACHGSFQGQGGFRLSLFGYDFQADHEALTKGDKPRADVAKPDDSLLLFKPTHEDEHEGGQRMEVGSWQYNLMRRWIVAGAKDDSAQQPELQRLEVIPAEILFTKNDQQMPLQAIAHWSNGDREDVTPLCRFQTNDNAVAAVDESGIVKATGTGDTHVVVFYDNGVTPIPVIQPISAEVAANYPQVPTPTKIDELVVQKLRKLGIVPSELSSDEEFLRRVSLDVTGTLPTPEQVKRFLADKSPDKRERKIEELLDSPGYAAWWATKICDITGNNAQQQGNNQFRNEESRQWYEWVQARIAKNVPYDEIVAGIVLATSRQEGQSYAEYCESMAKYYRKDEPVSFAENETLPHYWAKRNARNAEEKALGFAYAFLGVRLQCAQCHKHPFDQWSKQDFEHFTAFFGGITYGLRPEDRDDRAAMLESLGVDTKKPNNEQLRQLSKMVADGKPIPMQEVFVRTPRTNANRRNAKAKDRGASRVITPKVLGGEEVATREYGDLREALMEWMRSEDNPYFARAIVNRVWANYFNVGIIEPPDDQNLANPPSNEALLAHLTEEFIAHKYDLKWLHRTIVNSRTYQLSWRPNPTNRLDTRNFSRSVPRRLPAEVAYDALRFATAGDSEAEKMLTDVSDRAIGPISGYQNRGGRGGSYALLTFGKPARATNCDCERSTEPSLLQTLFLRNDGEMLTLLERKGGWLQQISAEPVAKKPTDNRPPLRQEMAELSRNLARVQQRISKLDKKKDADELALLEQRRRRLQRQLALLQREAFAARAKATEATKTDKVSPELVASRGKPLVREAYLRTLSREPSVAELATSLSYLSESESLNTGMRDLLWALLNTKEFIVNH